MTSKKCGRSLIQQCLFIHTATGKCYFTWTIQNKRKKDSSLIYSLNKATNLLIMSNCLYWWIFFNKWYQRAHVCHLDLNSTFFYLMKGAGKPQTLCIFQVFEANSVNGYYVLFKSYPDPPGQRRAFAQKYSWPTGHLTVNLPKPPPRNKPHVCMLKLLRFSSNKNVFTDKFWRKPNILWNPLSPFWVLANFWSHQRYM